MDTQDELGAGVDVVEMETVGEMICERRLNGKGIAWRAMER